MSNYKCSKCEYISTEKRNIEKHLSAKKCKDKNPTIVMIPSIITFSCKGCEKEYKSQKGLKYHIDRCDKIKEMKKPINILMMAQQQNGNEQLFEIIKNQQIQIDAFTNQQKQIDKLNTDVNVIKRYLSNWHSPYIYDNFHQLFLDALELGRTTDMSRTFPEFIKLIYNTNPENYTVCHKNKNKTIVKCHEDSKWVPYDSTDVYQKIKGVFSGVYFPLLKAELPYENKSIIKSKKLQLEYEEDNQNNKKHIKNTIKIIESDFQGINKLCDVNIEGECDNGAITFQNIDFIFKTKIENFKDVFDDRKIKLKDIEEVNEEENEITDNDEESDCDYELPEDNIDSYYDSTGELIGTIKEKNNFINWRRTLINERRSDKNFAKA